MKKLVLVRHAKSSWKYDVNDIDRPLKKSGISDAQLVSNNFKKLTFDFDITYCSPAKRAKETFDIFSKKLGFNTNNSFIDDDVYDFGGQKLTQFIKNIPNINNSVILFGHNHALTAFVNTYGSTYIDNLPTCGLVIIEFNINSWKELQPGKTVCSVFPRDLR